MPTHIVLPNCKITSIEKLICQTVVPTRITYYTYTLVGRYLLYTVSRKCIHIYSQRILYKTLMYLVAISNPILIFLNTGSSFVYLCFTSPRITPPGAMGLLILNFHPHYHNMRHSSKITFFHLRPAKL